MRSLVLLLVIACAATVAAQPSSHMSFREADHQWKHRLLYVFAPSEEHPDLLAQRQLTDGLGEAFRERDLLFVTVLERGESRVDGTPMDAASAERLRAAHDVEPGAFAVILVGKDGTEKRRSDASVLPGVLFEQIDRMPMRQREMRERGQG